MLKKIISMLLVPAMLLAQVSAIAFGEEVEIIDDKPDRLNWYSHSYEAEDVLVTGGFTLVSDSEASGGKALKSVSSGTATDPSVPPDIVVEFESDIDCKFFCSIRVKYTETADSFLYATNNNTYELSYVGDYVNEYVWVRKPVMANKGKNVFKIKARKLNVMIDRVVVTNHPEYVPSGVDGGECPNPDIYEKDGVELPSVFGYAKAPYVPQKETPRVLVNKEDIPRIKANLTHPQNIGAYNAIKRHLKLEPSVCYMPPVENRATGNYVSTGANYYIAAHALQYLLFGDKESGRKAIEGSIVFLKSIDVARVPHKDTTHVDRNLSGPMVAISATYDWCRDIMTEDEKKTIIDYGIALCQQSEVCWPPLHTQENAWDSGHHSEVCMYKTQLPFAVAIYDEYPQFYEILAERLFGEFIPFKNLMYEKSMANPVGNDYGRDTYEIYLPLILEKMGAKGVISDNFINNAYEIVFSRLPNGNGFPDGDIVTLDPGYKKFSTTFLLANLNKDPLLKQEAYNRESKVDYVFDSALLHLLCNDPDVEPKKMTAGLPLAVYTGDMTGTVYARTGWDLNVKSNNMAVKLKMAENFFKGHAHYDSGSFQIYYKGMLALDSGYYKNYNSDHSRYYLRQSIAHNCMLIYNPANDQSLRYSNIPVYGGMQNNGVDQVRHVSEAEEKTKIGEVLGVAFGDDLQEPDFSYLKGDLTKGYRGNADKYTRSFVFFNFFDEVYPGALVVFDKVKANTAYKRSWLLHTSNEPEIKGNMQIASRNDRGYNGRLINETLLPLNAEYEVIGGDGKEYLTGGVQRVEYASEDTGRYRVEISPKVNADTDYFLNVLQVSDNDDSIEPLKSEYIEGNTHAGVKIKDRVAFLSKNENRSARNVTFTIPGNGEKLKIMVDGMKEGTWSVIKDGKVIATREATERGGVVNFEGAPGTYTLSYSHTGFSEQLLPWFEYKGKDVVDDRIYVKLGKVLYDGLENPPIIEGEKIYASIEEVCPMLGLGKVLEKTETGYTVALMGNSKSFTFDELRLVNGVYYVDVNELADVLELYVKYNKLAGIINITTGLNVLTSDSIKNSDKPDRIFVERATAGATGIEKCLDGAIGTSWFDTVKGCSITFEFDKKEKVKNIRWALGNGKLRIYYYDIQISDDGKNFKTIHSGETISADGFEDIKIDPFEAKYVRIVGQGNTMNNYLTICEVEFYK